MSGHTNVPQLDFKVVAIDTFQGDSLINDRAIALEPLKCLAERRCCSCRVVEQPHFPRIGLAGQSESERRFIQSFSRKPKEYDLGFDRDTTILVVYLVDRKLGSSEKRIKDDAGLTD